MDPPQGVLDLNHRNTQENIEIFFRTTCLRCMKFGIASGAQSRIGLKSMQTQTEFLQHKRFEQ